MIKLDDQFLAELGLQSLPAEHKEMLLRTIYQELEMRVGTAIATQMTDYQLSDFERFMDAGEEAGAFSWLERNCPNYKGIVNEEFEKLRNEISALQGEIGAVSTFYAE